MNSAGSAGLGPTGHLAQCARSEAAFRVGSVTKQHSRSMGSEKNKESNRVSHRSCGAATAQPAVGFRHFIRYFVKAIGIWVISDRKFGSADFATARNIARVIGMELIG